MKSKDGDGKTISKVVLLGATLGTGNLGVSALAEASVKCIRRKNPEAEVAFVGLGRERTAAKLPLGGDFLTVSSWPIRFCRNLIVADHYIKLLLLVWVTRPLPCIKKCISQGTTAHVLVNAEMIYDITGGDSFSDIYGMKRFVLGYLTKRLCQQLGVPFVMLPQTYGPYKRSIAKYMARRVLLKSTEIFSRDQAGVETVRKLLDGKRDVKLSPDVAFVLDKREPALEIVSAVQRLKKGHTLVGVNVSGLLFHGGLTQDNQFGLKVDYPTLMKKCIDWFLDQPNTMILLIPHVIPPDRDHVENDHAVCRSLLNQLTKEQQKRAYLVDDRVDQGEVKYLIGLCDFFIGARMHSTIAALSQTIPAIGFAYSDKFLGVFETAGVQECVLDMRRFSNEVMIDKLCDLYQNHKGIRGKLKERIPALQDSVYLAFCNG